MDGRSVCCDAELKRLGPRLEYWYAVCRECGSIQLSPMPSAAALAAAYEGHYAAAKQTEEFSDPEQWEKVSRTYRESIVRALRDHRVSGLVVDCGCGWGHLVETMLRSGLDARGVDLSSEETAYAQRKGLPVHCGTLSDFAASEGKVSAVTMLAVFEHLADHQAVLAQVHRLLRDDGVFITLHPTAAFFRLLAATLRLGNRDRQLPDLFGAFAPPWHTVLFSIAGTQRVVERCGFEMIDIRPAPQGRLPGVKGGVQLALESVNRIGWPIWRTRWPLLTTHVFAFRKRTGETGSTTDGFPAAQVG